MKKFTTALSLPAGRNNNGNNETCPVVDRIKYTLASEE
jgi:hypothetical protein